MFLPLSFLYPLSHAQTFLLPPTTILSTASLIPLLHANILLISPGIDITVGSEE